MENTLATKLTKCTCKQLDMAHCHGIQRKQLFLRLSEVGGIVSEEASIGENRVARRRLFSTF